eukprot:TRINITY_DN26858_c0_g1_i1.p1 TRINITY_DN26858_c0_g1~~TRINITY_DN26858_c0_g1_i1.p1  ORF type:complete len:741 (+),score=240.16 TRINITY_DN26858_c0_g1_i1:353-2575(+)
MSTSLEWMPAPDVKGSSPFKRCWHSACLLGDSMFVFAGSFVNNETVYVFNDVHCLDLEAMAWSKVETTGEHPKGCWASAMCISTEEDDEPCLYAFGGRENIGIVNNHLSRLNLGTREWTRLEVTGDVPKPRCAAGLVCYRRCLYLFGGDSDAGVFFSQLHRLDLATMHWTLVNTAHAAPNARGWHYQAIMDNTMYVYGGTDGNYQFTDMTAFDFETSTWNRIEPSGAVPQARHGACLIPVGTDLMLFGGGSKNAATLQNEVYLFSTERRRWVLLPTSSSGPTPLASLFGHSGVFHRESNRIILYGGQVTGVGYNKEVYVLRLRETDQDSAQQAHSPTVIAVEEPERTVAAHGASPRPAIQTNANFHDQYKVLAKLGRGGFSVIYKVRSLVDENIYALKKMSIGKASADVKKRAQREVQLHRMFDHPYIVPLRSAFVEKNQSVVIVLDFCDGGDLYSMVQEAKRVGHYFSEEQIMKWFTQLLLAMEYLHKQNLLHQDLKSANVFFSRNLDVQLGDFGMTSQPLKPDEAKLLKGKREINGTPEYMSPELLNSNPPSQKTDVWSLGVILYEMCALEMPFAGKSFGELIDTIQKKNYPSLPAHYTDDMRHLVTQCLCKKENLRMKVNEILRLPFVDKYVQRMNVAPQFLPRPIETTIQSDVSSLPRTSSVPLIKPTPRATATQPPLPAKPVAATGRPSPTPGASQPPQASKAGAPASGSSARRNSTFNHRLRSNSLPGGKPVHS